MDEDQELKHICKFCSKSFPCGRSLGGHMRSHLINLSPANHEKNDEKKQPKKKLPPLVNPNKSSKSREQDTLLQDKPCKECGKSFHSWKALFGHMKCHSPNARITTSTITDHEDSCNSNSNKPIADSQSDNEGATPLRKKKRSDRLTKRYTSGTNASNFLPCVSEINDDQLEQEEVALSLIVLSRDNKRDWDRISPVFDSCDETLPKNLPHNSEDFAHKKSKFTCSICKKGFPSYQALGGHRASHKKFKGSCAPTSENCTIETEENKHSSPSQSDKEHECPICFKVFPSGQALGGHKRSHLIGDHHAKSGANPTVEITQTPPIREIRDFLDLNLPAPVEEECSDLIKPWWLGASHEHEPRLGLLSS